MIDTVTFDVWNTLVVNDYHDDRLRIHRTMCILEALNSRGYSYSWDQAVAAYDYSDARLADVWKTECDVSNDKHIIFFLEGLGLDASDGLVTAIREPYAHALLQFRPKLVEGAAELLYSLRDKGYRLGLISNTGRTPGRVMREVLEDYGMLRCFDSATFSDEAGYIKPSPRIYEMAMDSLGARPEGTVHVGDNPLLDVYGARACGIRAILFTKYMASFERYASKYYHANGRHAEPDGVVASLGEVEAALSRLAGKVNIK